MPKIMPKLAKLCMLLGRLRFAVSLILILAVILIFATFFESLYGTAAVQFTIYKTWWFGLLLILIGINVTLAALKKYPWKIHQVGFLVTHLGIVTLIIGSFVSFQWGIDASLPILNQEEKNFYLNRDELINIVVPENNQFLSASLTLGAYNIDRDIVTLSPSQDVSATVDRFFPFAQSVSTLVKSEKKGFPAIELELHNQFAHFQEQLILDEGTLAEKNLGPASLIFKKIENQSALKVFLDTSTKHSSLLGMLKLNIGEKSWDIELTQEGLSKPVSVPNSTFILKKIKYFSYAIVENSTLVNKKDEPINPAVKLVLSGPKGDEEHVAFSLFPDFPSTHQRKSLYGAKIEFVHQNDFKKNNLSIAVTQDQKLYYRVTSSQGIKSGSLHVGKTYETGWMNLTFKIHTFLPQAMYVTRYVPVKVQDPNNPKVPSVLRIRFESGNNKSFHWLTFSEKKEITFNDKIYEVSYEPKKELLPFSLYLEEFTMGKDPGTNNPASYQSRVVLKDELHNRHEIHVISMNEPLTYKGFTFYQSSYRTDVQGNPIGSVLSVGYDPGRILKYGGSLFIVMGIMLLFFFRKVYIQAWQEYKSRKVNIMGAREEDIHAV
ncbi:MAG TPA: cytochrome c biogenesis protein ResB [Bdellovibrionota bacterium]|nr:cytochrome c biogenesis protein ResB [Bdellovibrionota bacterium]